MSRQYIYKSMRYMFELKLRIAGGLSPWKQVCILQISQRIRVVVSNTFVKTVGDVSMSVNIVATNCYYQTALVC